MTHAGIDENIRLHDLVLNLAAMVMHKNRYWPEHGKSSTLGS